MPKIGPKNFDNLFHWQQLSFRILTKNFSHSFGYARGLPLFRTYLYREWISLHFLILSPFPLHFLILSPFSRSHAATLPQLVQPCLWLKFRFVILQGHISLSNSSHRQEKAIIGLGCDNNLHHIWFVITKNSKAVYLLKQREQKSCNNTKC